MKSTKLVEILRGNFEVVIGDAREKPNDLDLARSLGTQQPRISKWTKKGGKTLSPQEVAGLILRTREKGIASSLGLIAEHERIQKTQLRERSPRREFLDRENQMHESIIGDLKNSRGIYVFHDVQAKALYVGKTQKRTLWNEMNSAYNDRKAKIRRVGDLRHQTIRLRDAAVYFSAFDVEDALIHNLEALLLKLFWHSLIFNTNKGNFKLPS